MDKLGKRLCRDEATESDWELFQEILGCYQEVLDVAQERLRQAGLAPTGRVKTTDTLLDKLRRGTSFKSLQDLAGTRIVVAGGRNEQDAVRDTVCGVFAEPEPKVTDRRVEPIMGYRAVHVVAKLDGLPLEVQIRTEDQHAWAEVTEALGDRWGRGLRYGVEFEGHDQRAHPAHPMTRGEFMEMWISFADALAAIEELEQTDAVDSPWTTPGSSIDESREVVASVLEQASALVSELEEF